MATLRPGAPRQVTQLPLPAASGLFRARGAEIGRFNMGSTVVLLFARDRVALARQLGHGTDDAHGAGAGFDRRPACMTHGDWRPGTDIAALRLRAKLLDHARGFFRDLRRAGSGDPGCVVAHRPPMCSWSRLQLAGNPPRFLADLPRIAMKRLLAAGSGDIFQICRVFRAGERSRLHNPEFTMVEWYRSGVRPGSDHARDGRTGGPADCNPAGNPPAPVELLSYGDAFERALGCDALTASLDGLAALAAGLGLAAQSIANASRDDLLDFLVATQVGQGLGRGQLTCLHHFPASQAALAQLDATDPRTALRFELYA